MGDKTEDKMEDKTGDKPSTLVQGWTSLNENPSWSWSFLAPIILPELELELLGSEIFQRAGAGANKLQTFLPELES